MHKIVFPDKIMCEKIVIKHCMSYVWKYLDLTRFPIRTARIVGTLLYIVDKCRTQRFTTEHGLSDQPLQLTVMKDIIIW